MLRNSHVRVERGSPKKQQIAQHWENVNPKPCSSWSGVPKKQNKSQNITKTQTQKRKQNAAPLPSPPPKKKPCVPHFSKRRAISKGKKTNAMAGTWVRKVGYLKNAKGCVKSYRAPGSWRWENSGIVAKNQVFLFPPHPRSKFWRAMGFGVLPMPSRMSESLSLDGGALYESDIYGGQATSFFDGTSFLHLA